MRRSGERAATILIAGLALVLITASSTMAEETEGDTAAQPNDFAHQVAPILRNRCGDCHTGEEREGGLSLNTLESMLRGGRGGPAVVPGDADVSFIYEIITDPDPEMRMPPEEERMPAEEIAIIRAWIEAGAPWEDGFALGRVFERAPLKPREVKLPAAGDSQNPIDRLLRPYYQEHGIEAGARVDDRTYIRRVYMDLLGLLPSPEQVAAFEADTRPDKRERLVAELLANDRHYADHWLAFWNDALRNAYRGTGFIDDGRRQITGWLYQALYYNMPYDEFVHQLVDPEAPSEGFTRGIIWRGVVNASQRREMQAAQSVSQVFLGSNLKCSSCHDSFDGEWKLEEAYALASVFAQEPLEVARCDAPLGKTVKPAFLFPELGQIDPDAPLEQRTKQLADLMVHPDNGRLTRTIVNRLWAELMGRGIVWPTDEMDNTPFHRDLLDFLAEDFRKNGYDLKHTLRLIATSQAYQLPPDRQAMPEMADYVFRGPLVQRMSAEQFVDGVSKVTGIWQEVSSAMLERDPRGQGGQLTAVREALARNSAVADTDADADASDDLIGRWIWRDADAAQRAQGGGIYLRRTFTLEQLPHIAHAVMTADNQFEFYINGDRVATGNDWQHPAALDLTPYLRRGSNTLAVLAINWPDTERGIELSASEPNPAGWFFSAVGYDIEGKTVWSLGSDARWKFADTAPDAWHAPGFDDAGWRDAVSIGGPNVTPWRAESLLKQALQSRDVSDLFTDVRAVMAVNDALFTAMGQPNREQVVTERDSIATTLQALELINGYTLDATLRRGARKWLERDIENPEDLVVQLYQAALSREPNDGERRAAVALVGSTPSVDGVQDLLWALVMLPEFQLIY
ncbi:MAG: DUF1549 domain-containing protein [Phycisphaeraceae bacterium]